MSTLPSKRLPLSCENCRQRKIRCQNSDERAPCDTCLRRGYSSTCRFRRGSSSQIPALDNELAREISDLTDLLKRNINLTTESLDRRGEEIHRLASPESESTIPISPKQSNVSNINISTTGRLSTVASDHVRYVPFNRTRDANLLEVMQEPLYDPLATFPFTASPDSLVSRQDILNDLPPWRICDQLKDIFLNVFSRLLHILHEPTFESRYRQFKDNPQLAPLSFVALLFVIFYLAADSLDDNHALLSEIGRDNMRSPQAYRYAAMRCLSANNFMSQHNLFTLQSLILLIYAINYTGGSTWTFLGTTLHIAVAIGCSVDPDHLNVDIIEAEERRRAWAALMILYNIQSTRFGNLTPFRIQTDVAPPANVNDDELLDGTRSKSSSIPSSLQRLTQMTYLLSNYQLYDLTFDICRLSSSTQLPPRDLTTRLDQQLGVELRKHMSLFEDVTRMPFYHVAHFYIVSSHINHLFLLLHRPYLGPVECVSTAEPLMGHIRESCHRCHDSSMKILSNFESFYHNDNLKPYRFYLNGLGSFQVFLAITTLLAVMATGMLPKTSNLAMTTAINTSMEKLREMAKRSETCAKALVVLEPLVQPQTLGSPPQLSLGETAPYLRTPAMVRSGGGGGMKDDVRGSFQDIENWNLSEQWLLQP